MTEKERAEKRAQSQRKYQHSENGKQKTRDAYKRYRQTPKGREARKRNRG